MAKKNGRASSLSGFGFEAMQFGIDSAAVVILRSVRIACGGRPAKFELSRMVSEKVDAHAAFAAAFFGGRAGTDPAAVAVAMLAHYGPRVRANRRRLAQR